MKIISRTTANNKKTRQPQRCSKRLFAMQLFPGYAEKYALKLLNKLIVESGLHDALEHAGYKPHDRYLSPRVQNLIRSALS